MALDIQQRSSLGYLSFSRPFLQVLFFVGVERTYVTEEQRQDVVRDLFSLLSLCVEKLCKGYKPLFVLLQVAYTRVNLEGPSNSLKYVLRGMRHACGRS